MAHIRRLLSPEQKRVLRAGEDPGKPRGLWQATVRHPSGQRFSKSDPLKKVVQIWAEDEEAKIRRGEWIDPNGGKVTLAQWRDKWLLTRRVALSTEAKSDSIWRCHIEPQFGTWPLAAIQSWDVEAWVAGMEDGGVGKPTVNAALRLLGQMLRAAGKHKLLGGDPTNGVTATRPDAHIDRILTPAEADRLLEQFADEDRLFVELLLYCGLRWQEAAGLRRFRVDLMRRRIQIAKVLPRKGGEKDPKTPSGVRLVPLEDDMVAKLSRAIPAPDNQLVFTSQTGKRLHYPRWHVQIWAPALERAKLADPQPTAHDLRHTFGSWLAEDGVPPHQIAALMGHKSLRSVERYIHPTELRFEQARGALRAARERQEVILERDSGIPK